MKDIQRHLPAALRSAADRLESGEMLGLTVAAFGDIVLVMPVTKNQTENMTDAQIAQKLLALAGEHIEALGLLVARGGRLNG